MAEETKPRKKRTLKKSETVRQKIDQAKKPAKQPKKRVRRAAKVALKPFSVFRIFRFLVPSYFRNSWKELRQVTWPTRKETWKMTFAVFVFATVFGVTVAITDYALDKVFKQILLR